MQRSYTKEEPNLFVQNFFDEPFQEEETRESKDPPGKTSIRLELAIQGF